MGFPAFASSGGPEDGRSPRRRSTLSTRTLPCKRIRPKAATDTTKRTMPRIAARAIRVRGAPAAAPCRLGRRPECLAPAGWSCCTVTDHTTHGRLKGVLIVLAVASLAFLPGALALRCAGVSWRWALALGPAVSLLLAEVLATVYYKAGLPYNRTTALVGVLVVLCVIVFTRLATRRWPVRESSGDAARPRSRVPWWVYLGAIVGAVLLAVPLVVVMGSGGAVLQQWDGVYHLSAIRAVREYQTASSLWGMAPLYRDGGAPTFFPSAFHALVSLAPGAGVQVLNSAIYVFGVAVWAAGLVALATVIDDRLAGRLGLRRYVLPAVVVPISAAFSLTLRSVASSPPNSCARACAASLPEAMSKPCKSCSTVYVPPGPMPTAEPSICADSSPTSTFWCRSSSSITTCASSALMMEAGR